MKKSQTEMITHKRICTYMHDCAADQPTQIPFHELCKEWNVPVYTPCRMIRRGSGSIGDDQRGRLGQGAGMRDLEALLPPSPGLPRRAVLIEGHFPAEGEDFQRVRVLPAPQREGVASGACSL